MSKKYENYVFVQLNKSRGLSYERFKVIKLLKAQKLEKHVTAPKFLVKYDKAP